MQIDSNANAQKQDDKPTDQEEEIKVGQQSSPKPGPQSQEEIDAVQKKIEKEEKQEEEIGKQTIIRRSNWRLHPERESVIQIREMIEARIAAAQSESEEASTQERGDYKPLED